MAQTKQIPKGYKMTKLGVIPEEWEVVKLGDIGKVKMCKRIFSNQTLPKGDIPFYKIGTFGKKADAFITKELYMRYKNKFSFPKVGEILMSASGTLGRTVVYDGKPSYFQDSNIVWISHDETKILNEFLLYVYRIIRYDSEGGTIQRLYNSIILNAKLRLPPLSEQQKIAAILSTWDKAIATQEALITQKEQLKKGLMQELLTGKKRFAGFEEEWEEIKMKDVLTIGSGKDYKHLEKGSIPVYGSGGVMTYVNKSLYSGESVGIGRKGTIDKPVFLDGEFWTVDTLFYTHSFVKCTAKYIYYLFKTIDWYRYNEASGVPSLSKNTIYSIKINLPPIEEQQKIANTLSSADKEIENLKTQLATMKLQKQGLMQELLTGKRRVKIE